MKKEKVMAYGKTKMSKSFKPCSTCKTKAACRKAGKCKKRSK